MQCTARPGVCSRKQQLVQHGSVPQLRIAPVRRLQSGSIRCASDPAKSPILQRRPASVVYSDRQQLSDLIISSSPGAAAPSRRRLRVAVDVDEVLGRFVYALNQFCHDEFGMKYNVEDYWVYEFAKIWGCTQDRSNHIVHEFFKSSHFNDGIPVVPGALEALQRLSEHCDLVVVTSRQHVIQDVTLSWIDRHYAGLFREVYFGNHFALQGASRKKSEICASIGAHVLIDDNPSYAIDCASNGIQVLLYDWEDGYPWAKLPQSAVHPNIQVVRNWGEVETALAALAVPQQP